MDLSIERSEENELVVLTCTGRLDAETTEELALAVATELRRGCLAIRLDLNGTSFLSSAGIRSLFEVQRSAKSAGGSCFIRRASSVVQRVLDLTRLATIMMEPNEAEDVATEAAKKATRSRTSTVPIPPPDITSDGIRLLSFEAAPSEVQGRLIGSPSDAVSGKASESTEIRIEPHDCGLGLASLADGQPILTRAGELAAVAGAVFHRPPQPHVAIDYIVPTAELVAEANVLAGLIWKGLPGGRSGFEPAGDEPFVRLDELFEAVLTQTNTQTLAVIVAGEVHGLVGVELIRPLAEATVGDAPVSGLRDVAASWLSFSREPVYARQTALIVGVVSRTKPEEPLAAFLRAVPGRAFSSHCHAVVFPFRPLRREGLDLAATVADLAVSTPLAVLHLIADPLPVLGSGRSELYRGSIWFAPLSVEQETSNG
jgi:anti-anti-sigma factor